jgi:FecR protein
MIMRGIVRQTIAVLCAGLLIGLPVSAASANNLVGVAAGTGSATINGQRLDGQASVYSGDRLQTGQNSPLTVVSSPQERLRLDPDSSVRLLKSEGTTLATLEEGSLDLESAGSTQAVLGPTGVAIRPVGTTRAVAEVKALPKGVYQVSVAEGAVEVVDGDTTTKVDSGHTALVGTPSSNDPPDSDKGNGKKKAAIVILLAGANIAAVAAVLANEGSKSVSPAVP